MKSERTIEMRSERTTEMRREIPSVIPISQPKRQVKDQADCQPRCKVKEEPKRQAEDQVKEQPKCQVRN